MTSIASHFLLVGDYQGVRLNPVTWSLVYEMRISLLMPVICWAIRRRALMTMGLSFVAFCLIAFEVLRTGSGPWPMVNDSPYMAVLITGYFTGFFCLGAGIAWRFLTHPEEIMAPTRGTLVILLALSLGLFSAADPLVAIGAASVMLLGLGHRGLQGALSWRGFAWLGRVSYSLYVTHYIVLLMTIHLLHEILPIPALIVTGLSAALLVAEITYRCVEAPSIRFARAISRHDPSRARKPARPGVVIADT